MKNVEEVRKMLKEACAVAGSQLRWAEAHDLSSMFVSDVVNGRRPPSRRILEALGLERVIVYRPRT